LELNSRGAETYNIIVTPDLTVVISGESVINFMGENNIPVRATLAILPLLTKAVSVTVRMFGCIASDMGIGTLCAGATYFCSSRGSRGLGIE
jgi:F0F1-type ATP synthase membrane subunit a